MAKIDFESWLKRNSKRIGVPEDLVRKAYLKEFTEEHGAEEPLEVPDVMRVFYKYSYGQQSRFFRELRDNKKLYATKCKECGFRYCPPRANCSKCYGETEWVELTGKGAVVACTAVHATTSEHIKRLPFLCAYVKLDGTDTVMMTQMEMEDITKAKPGMRVNVEFREERDGRITDFYFKPVV
jgi:uncharacterized OB-fold protein